MILWKAGKLQTLQLVGFTSLLPLCSSFFVLRLVNIHEWMTEGFIYFNLNMLFSTPYRPKTCFLSLHIVMFLLDLKKWREQKVGKQLLDCVLKNADGSHVMYFLEQDLMNMTFYGHLKLLSPRYNMLTSIYLFDYLEVQKMKKPVIYYTEQEIKDAKKKPAIFHATTCFYVGKRMWVEGSDHPCANLYIKYTKIKYFI